MQQPRFGAMIGSCLSTTKASVPGSLQTFSLFPGHGIKISTLGRAQHGHPFRKTKVQGTSQHHQDWRDVVRYHRAEKRCGGGIERQGVFG